MPVKNYIPNLLTCGNLFLGGLAVVEVFQGNLAHVIFYTILAAILDFMDGFAARLLKAYSNIGKDLDSLADMVSFGLVPALLMFKMVQNTGASYWLSIIPISIAVLSGLRLAKFNNDERQTDSFYGLPTPANALFFCSLPLLVQDGILVMFLSNDIILVVISIIMALLLVADIKLIALKFKGFGWKGNESKYLLILISLGLLLTFQWVALPFIILLYITMSFLALLIPNN